MGSDYSINGWPRCGEIDIVEMGNVEGIKNGTQDRFFNGACHWGFYKDGNYPNYAKSTTNKYSLQDGEFHTFTLEWDGEYVSMYLDKEKYPDAAPYYKMGVSETSDDWSTGRYFQHSFFILFNLAVGGYFTGLLNPTDITALPDNGEAKMYVDWVRVYQKTDDINAVVPDNYSNGIKNYYATDNKRNKIYYDLLGRRMDRIEDKGLYLVQSTDGMIKCICKNN